MPDGSLSTGPETGSFTPENTPSNEVLAEQLRVSNDKERRRLLKEQLKAEQNVGVEGIQKRALLLRDIIRDSIDEPTEQQALLDDLSTAQSETLGEMQSEGEIDWLDRYAQEYLPYEWSTTTKKRTALGAVVVGGAVGAVIAWKTLKRLVTGAKKAVVDTTKKAGGGLMTVAKWGLVGLGVDQFFFKGQIRRSLMGFIEAQAFAGEMKEKVEDLKDKARDVKEQAEDIVEDVREETEDLKDKVKTASSTVADEAEVVASEEADNVETKLKAKEWMRKLEDAGLLGKLKINPDEYQQYELALIGLLKNKEALGNLRTEHLVRILTVLDVESVWKEVNPDIPLSPQQALLLRALAGSDLLGGSEDESVAEALDRKSIVVRSFGRVRQAVQEGKITQPTDLAGIASTVVELSGNSLNEVIGQGDYLAALDINDKTQAREFIQYCTTQRSQSIATLAATAPEKYKPALRKLQEFIKRTDVQDLLLSCTHDVPKARETLKAYLDQNLVTGDAIQLYLYVQMAGGAEGSIPKSLRESDGSGALLLQLKVLQVVKMLNKRWGSQLEASLTSKALNGPENLNLPPESVALVQQLTGIVGKELLRKGEETGRQWYYWLLYGLQYSVWEHPVATSVILGYMGSRARRFMLNRDLRRMRTGAGITQMSESEIRRSWGIIDTAQARSIADEFVRQRGKVNSTVPLLSGWNARTYQAKLAEVMVNDLSALSAEDIATRLDVSAETAAKIHAEVMTASRLDAGTTFIGRLAGARRRQMLTTLRAVRALLKAERKKQRSGTRTEINSETEVETETEVRPSETRTDEASAAENTDEDTEENAEPTLDEQVAAENDQTNKEALQELRSAQTELQAVLADTALSPAERLAKLQDLKARCAQAARDIETQQNANAALNQPNNGPVTTALLADIEATEQQISAEVSSIETAVQEARASAEKAVKLARSNIDAATAALSETFADDAAKAQELQRSQAALDIAERQLTNLRARYESQGMAEVVADIDAALAEVQQAGDNIETELSTLPKIAFASETARTQIQNIQSNIAAARDAITNLDVSNPQAVTRAKAAQQQLEALHKQLISLQATYSDETLEGELVDETMAEVNALLPQADTAVEQAQTAAAQSRRRRPRSIGSQSASVGDITATEQNLDVNAFNGETESDIDENAQSDIEISGGGRRGG